MNHTFIEKEVEMLKAGYGDSQIKGDIYKYVFSNYIHTATMNAMIEMCMSLYCEIITRYSKSNEG